MEILINFVRLFLLLSGTNVLTRLKRTSTTIFVCRLIHSTIFNIPRIIFISFYCCEIKHHEQHIYLSVCIWILTSLYTTSVFEFYNKLLWNDLWQKISTRSWRFLETSLDHHFVTMCSHSLNISLTKVPVRAARFAARR